MIGHNSTELYGAESIQYMESRNFINIIIWAVTMGGCFALMQRCITRQYSRIGVEQSIQDFRQLLTLELGGIIILSLLWWFVTSIGGPQIARWRSCFEQNSCICAVIFSFLAFGGACLLMFIGKFGIKTNNGHFQTLCCPFILPAVFVCLMYAVPPVHIREVIYPGKRTGRLLIAITAALTAVILFKIDFL